MTRRAHQNHSVSDKLPRSTAPFARANANLSPPPQLHNMKKPSPHQRCSRNRQHPSPHNPPRHAPTHRRQPVRRPHTHNRASNRMRGANRNPKMRSRNQSQRPSGLRRKSSERIQLRNPLPHRLDNPPTARHRPARHRQMTTNTHPIRHREIVQQASSHQCGSNNSHPLLRVIRSVP